MQYSCESHDEAFVVRLSGEFSMGNESEAMEAEIMDTIEAGPRRVVLDFQGVSYINSSGVLVLLRLQRALEVRDATLIMCNVEQFVAKVLGALHVTGRFPQFETVEAALAADA